MVDEFAVLKHHRYLVRELGGASAGTEYYLAPEHLGDDVRSDVLSDMFQLGALVFRMITGEGLVTGYTAHEALHKVSATGCRTLRSVQPQVSRDLDAFVSRLTAIDRKDRPQAWSEVLEVCDRFGGGARTQTFRVTQPISASSTTRGYGLSTGSNTGTVTRSMHSGSGVTRRDPQSGIRHSTAGRVRDDGSNGVLILSVVLVVLASAFAVVWAFSRLSYRPPSTAPTSRPLAPVTSPPPASAPGPAASPAPPAGPESASTRMPGFMGGGPANGGGVGESANNHEIGSRPGDPSFAELMQQISQAEREQRYKDALLLCDRLPIDFRQTRAEAIHASHLAKRTEVAKQVKQAATLDQARALLEAALAKWNQPGDAEWAQQAMLSAGSEPAPVAPAPAPATATQAPVAKLAPAPATLPAVTTPAKSGESVAETAWR